MVKTALYSFWSKPFLAKAEFKTFGEFNTKEDFLLSWCVSVKLARRHFARVILVTDTWAWKNLFEPLGLPIDDVRIILDDIDHTTDMWSSAKAYAILEMDEPFIHLDPDVYLWDELSDEILGAKVFAQSREGKWDPYQDQLYTKRSEDYHRNFEGACKYFDNFRAEDIEHLAYNAGVVGGNDLGFLKSWAQNMLDLVYLYDEKIQSNQFVGERYLAIIWVEQALIRAMEIAEGYQIKVVLEDPNIDQEFYTHLCGGSKKNEEYMKSLRIVNDELLK
jgi:hypothetical protein